MEHLDVHYLEWVSVPLNQGGRGEGQGHILLFLGGQWSKPRMVSWGLPLLTPVEEGQLGPFFKQVSTCYH